MQHPRSAAMRGLLAFVKLLEVAATLVRLPDAAPAVPEPDSEWETPDRLPEYSSQQAGELIVSRYDDGATRRENPVSGVIQEDRPDGSLTVSLPGGRVIAQRYQGEPLLVVDLENGTAPVLGRVASMTLEGQPRLVYHFEDAVAVHHIFEMSSLRYFRVRGSSSSDDEE